MRILVLGGTGPTGMLLIEALLADRREQHSLVLFARSPQKLPDHIAQHADVTVAKGELTDEDALSGAMNGVDIVLSALGPLVKGHPSGNPIATGYALVFTLMKRHGIPRIILLGTPSVKDPHDRWSAVYAAMVAGISLYAGNAYKDIVAVGEVVDRSEGVVWTMVRVPILRDKDEAEVEAGYVGDGKVGFLLARKGFAAFVVREMHEAKWSMKRPLIASKSHGHHVS
ncbi:NAD(P)-binding protein [Amylostereum chailletii]|nr:NAD(P)-binding protein [Amylostereum chailletii]